MRCSIVVGAVAVLLAAVPAVLAAPAPFVSSITPIPASYAKTMTSWHPGCPVPLAQLRLVHVTHLDMGGAARQGRLVVHRRYAVAMVRTMRTLYAIGFRIERMQLPERYGSDDHRMMRANNTSAFNCRFVSGTRRWSEHAYGQAIDVNPVQNPWVDGSFVSPPAGERYTNRRQRRPGLLRAGSPEVAAFSRMGWSWGGRWIGAMDYMHFSASGR